MKKLWKYPNLIKLKKNVNNTLPKQYSKFVDVFSENKADLLQKHRKFNCVIDLKDLKLLYLSSLLISYLDPKKLLLKQILTKL